MQASIVISSYNRKKLFERTLYSIARFGPSCDFEVIVVDDNSTEDILSCLKPYNSVFNWKFVKTDVKKFENVTGIKKFLNNPALTNNIGCRLAQAPLIFQQGNEIIATPNIYDNMMKEAETLGNNFIVFCTTLDVPNSILSKIDPLGTNIDINIINECAKYPLQCPDYKANITNHLSLMSRETWVMCNGYDERYLAGIAAEDSDFLRRARKSPNFKESWNNLICLHQSHGGKTMYYDANPNFISKERWREGVLINKQFYDNWNGDYQNHQLWEVGTIGIEEIISNVQ